MDDVGDLGNTSVLSESYKKGLNRITGNDEKSTIEEELKICEAVLENREKTWLWLFDKFSEIFDDIELNIHTLKPDAESSGSHGSDLRIPVRKSTAQIQYWINTGNAPCRAMDAEESGDSDWTISISESGSLDFDEAESLPSASMIVNKKLTNSREPIATESSGSSVDTASYILKNVKSGRKKGKDSRASNPLGNSNNNIVGRSINATKPKALLSRSMESPKTGETSGRISLLHKSMSCDIDEETNIRPSILFDKNISRKTDGPLGRGFKSNEIKDSEATPESKESGIGSLAVENVNEGETAEAKKSPSSSNDEIMPRNISLNQLHRRRKLYTNDDSCCDIQSSTVKTVQRITAARKSFHPALDSPSTCSQKKTVVRPRLFTMFGVRAGKRMSKNYSVDRRSRNKSFLSKSRVQRSSGISRGGETKPASLVEIGNSLADKDGDRSVNVGRDVEVRNEEAESRREILSPNSNTKRKQASESKRSVDASSSLSSNDASQIINEEVNKISEREFVDLHVKNRVGNYVVEDIGRSERKGCENDRGSIFEALSNSSPETRESRAQGMHHVKKNLYEMDLKSSRDTDSPSVTSYNIATKPDEDSISNATTVLLPSSRRRVKCSTKLTNDFNDGWKNYERFMPTVILHDFLDLKYCCGESERRNNEYWLRRENSNAKNSKNDEKEDGEKVTKINSGGKNGENIKSMKSMSRKVSAKKKQKLKNKAASSKEDEKILTNAGCVTDDSHLEVMTSYLRSEKPDDDSNHCATKGSNCSGKMENNGENVDSKKSMIPVEAKLKLGNTAATSKENVGIRLTTNVGSHDSQALDERLSCLRMEKLDDDFSHRTNKCGNVSQGWRKVEQTGGNSTITFTTTNHNQWESIFLLTSSDEEDLFKKLSNTSTSRSSRRKKAGNVDEVKGSNSVTKKTTLDDGGAPRSTKTLQDCYTIVFSSSEGEEMTVKTVSNVTRPRRVRKKYSKRNKRGNSPESELTMCLSGDECADRSESFENENEKLEKQSTGVNRRSATKESKQSREARRDYLVPQSKVNSEILTDRKSGAEKVRINRNKPAAVIFGGKTNDVDTVGELGTNDKENYPNEKISENRKTPVDRVPDFSRKLAQGNSETNSRFKDVEETNSASRTEKSRIFSNGNTLRKIARLAESSESENDPEDRWAPNYKDRSKRCPNVDEEWDDESGNDRREPSAFRLVFTDESSDDHDALTLFSKNYAGDNSRDKRIRLKDKEDASLTIGSNKHPVSPNKRGINFKNDAFSSAKKKKVKDRRTSSKIVFRTKEFWESDSNNS